MTLDDILGALFGPEHGLRRDGDILVGRTALADGTTLNVLGITGGAELGVDQTILLAARVLDVARSDDRVPLLFLVDSSSQRMSRRDELMGLNEYLAHLAKSLMLAERSGHRTIGLLYGGSAAGAFIATLGPRSSASHVSMTSTLPR